MADEEYVAGIIQNHWNGNFVSIPGKTRKSPLDQHLSHVKTDKNPLSVPLKTGIFTGSISPAVILLHKAN